MTEAQFLAAVRQLARIRGWRVYHTHDSRRSEPGFPDLAMVHPGQKRIVFAELKTATGRISPEQDGWIADLAAAGAEVHLWRPTDLQHAIPHILGASHSRAPEPPPDRPGSASDHESGSAARLTLTRRP